MVTPSTYSRNTGSLPLRADSVLIQISRILPSHTYRAVIGSGVVVYLGGDTLNHETLYKLFSSADRHDRRSFPVYVNLNVANSVD